MRLMSSEKEVVLF